MKYGRSKLEVEILPMAEGLVLSSLILVLLSVLLTKTLQRQYPQFVCRVFPYIYRISSINSCVVGSKVFEGAS